MKKFLVFFIYLFCIFLVSGCNRGNILPKIEEEADYKYFLNSKNGAMIFYDEKKNIAHIYNKELAEKRVSPCSTFKIPATLIGLKYKILEDKSTLFKWDGKKREFSEWNQDLTLEKAFKYSAVWYFYKVSQSIKKEDMQKSIKELSYGNEDISKGGTFWLDSSLKISPIEQVEFLYKLFNNKFDVPESHIKILKTIMYRGKINGGNLYGKTGSSATRQLGLFVGIYEKKGNRIFFAVELSKNGYDNGPSAQKITENILSEKF